MHAYWDNFWQHRSKDNIIDNFVVLVAGVAIGYLLRGFRWVGKQTAIVYRKQMGVFTAMTPEEKIAYSYEYRKSLRMQILQSCTLLVTLLLVAICYALMHDNRSLSAHLFGWFAILVFCIPVAIALYDPFSTGGPYRQWHFFRTILFAFVIAAIPVSIKLYLPH